MTTVYLPLEISRREALAKAFLATSLVKRGHDVLIFKSDIFDRVGWPGPGIYVGKNVFRGGPPHDLTQLESMREHGVRVWYLEEEGGIYLGNTEENWCEMLAKRMDPAVLDDRDKVLAWGQWQKEYFDRLPRASGPRPEVLVAGCSNFDILQPKYHEALFKLDLAQTGGARDFILINTRFTFANARDNGQYHFIHHGPISKLFDRDLLFQKLASDGTVLYAFVELTAALASRFPDREIVLRPHPGENVTTYKRLFAPLSNVRVEGSGDVGSWIRLSSWVIHNGCSTAVQADIATKPVISFVPTAGDDTLVAGLPNEVGTICRTVSEVIDAVGGGAAGAAAAHCRPWQRTISHLDTVDLVTGLVDKESLSAGRLDRWNARRLALQYDLTELARGAARVAMPEKRDALRKYFGLFDYPYFRKIPEMADCAGNFYGEKARVRRLSNFCFLFSAS